MRNICLLALVTTLATGAVAAQSTTTAGGTVPIRRPHSSPLDKGPFTPEASRAYQGGGMILEGAPGTPAPRPEPTPPGQTPRNMVPLPPPTPSQ